MKVELTAEEEATLRAIPNGGMDARNIFVDGVSPQKKSRVLASLEQKGFVERYPNGHGPETPWWWMRLPVGPEEFESPLIEKGTIYDRYTPGNVSVVHFETTGRVNEYGCAEGSLKAGDNNARRTWVPLRILARFDYWTLRRRGEVSVWSEKFHCSVHGQCTEQMVRTDKCCAICGRGLIVY